MPAAPARAITTPTLKHARSVCQTREVKIVDVVAGDDVGVGVDEELAPRAQQVGLVVEREHLRARDRRALLQREDVLDIFKQARPYNPQWRKNNG